MSDAIGGQGRNMDRCMGAQYGRMDEEWNERRRRVAKRANKEG